MKTCPACKQMISDAYTRCPFCGADLQTSPPRRLPEQSFSYHSERAKGPARWIKVLALGLAGGILITGIFWYFRVAPRLKSIRGEFDPISPSKSKRVEAERNLESDFDWTIDLGGDPLGIVWNNGEFMIGNRADPWGFMRVVYDNEGYRIQNIPVTEPAYNQKISLWNVTWNGKEYVAIADGSYFNAPGKLVFTTHDRKTLRLMNHYPAPDLIGGLTWDGSGYWAATRRNTADSSEPAFLYQIDSDFNVIDKTDPPAVGCQGLAWDGEHLWFVDVFSDNIYILDPSDDPVRVVHNYETELDYLSGIAFDGRSIWITEYDKKQMHRLAPTLQRAWLTGEPQQQVGSQNIEEEIPVSASPKTSDSYESTPSYASNDAEVIQFSAEISSNAIFASWEIFFGPDLFSTPTESEEGVVSFPTFAKYTFTISGGSLSAPIIKTYDAVSGDNTEENVTFAENLGPGVYSIALFIHVQYVDPEGTNRILNNSVPSLEVEN